MHMDKHILSKKMYSDPNDEHYALLYGPDSIVAKVQGQNKVGGSLNHYYDIIIVSGENMDEDSQSLIDYYETLVRLSDVTTDPDACVKSLVSLKGHVDDYYRLSDSYKIEDIADEFNVGKINNALNEYWTEKGF